MLQLELHPSRYLLSLLLLIHAGAILLLLPLSIPWWVKLLGVILLLVNFCVSVRQYVARRSQQAIIKASVNEQGQWFVTLRQGNTHPAKLLPHSYCSQWCVILRLTVQLENKAKRRAIVIMPDSVSASVFRRLRSYLLHCANTHD